MHQSQGWIKVLLLSVKILSLSRKDLCLGEWKQDFCSSINFFAQNGLKSVRSRMNGERVTGVVESWPSRLNGRCSLFEWAMLVPKPDRALFVPTPLRPALSLHAKYRNSYCRHWTANASITDRLRQEISLTSKKSLWGQSGSSTSAPLIANAFLDKICLTYISGPGDLLL